MAALDPKLLLDANGQPPPPLRPPKATQTFELPPECQKYLKKPLDIRYVEGFDWQSFDLNLVTALIVALAIGALLKHKVEDMRFVVAIPLSFVAVLSIIFKDRMWTTVQGRKAKVFLNNLTRELTVYLKGFHFVFWGSTPENDDVSYQKHEIMEAKKADGTQISFPSQDGYVIELDLFLMFARRSEMEAMAHSLNYDVEELKKLIWATIQAALTSFGGCNSFKSILYYREDMIKWIANYFGGRNNLSPLEIYTGTTIEDPIAKNVGLNDESMKLFMTYARIDMIAQGTKQLIGANVSPDEAAKMVQTLEGEATRIIYTYEGIPEGAKVVALGDSGIALAAGGNTNKGKGKPK